MAHSWTAQAWLPSKPYGFGAFATPEIRMNATTFFSFSVTAETILQYLIGKVFSKSWGRYLRGRHKIWTYTAVAKPKERRQLDIFSRTFNYCGKYVLVILLRFTNSGYFFKHS
jgi:hypothetical protein